MRLLDSSSLFESLLKRNIEALSEAHTLDLTRYELGNIVWKKINLLNEISHEEGQKMMSVIVKTLKNIKTISISGLESDVLRLAHEESLAFYDAAYIEVARRKKLILITEDKEMRIVCEKLGYPVASLGEI